MPHHFCAWLALPQELDATVPVATGLGVITAKLVVARAPCAPHQIAGQRQHQRHPQLRHLLQDGCRPPELVVARIAHVEATSSSSGNWQEESQLASRNANSLEGYM